MHEVSFLQQYNYSKIRYGIVMQIALDLTEKLSIVRSFLLSKVSQKLLDLVSNLQTKLRYDRACNTFAHICDDISAKSIEKLENKIKIESTVVSK